MVHGAEWMIKMVSLSNISCGLKTLYGLPGQNDFRMGIKRKVFSISCHKCGEFSIPLALKDFKKSDNNLTIILIHKCNCSKKLFWEKFSLRPDNTDFQPLSLWTKVNDAIKSFLFKITIKEKKYKCGEFTRMMWSFCRGIVMMLVAKQDFARVWKRSNFLMIKDTRNCPEKVIKIIH